MRIELDHEQYLKLIELVYLGEWMANSYRTGDEFNEEYDEIMQYILSLSKYFELDYVDYDEEDKYYFTTRKLEERLSPTIDNYDENTFWDELADRLAKRDVLKEYGPVREMTEEIYNRKLEIEDEYRKEFAKYGLKNLLLNNK